MKIKQTQVLSGLAISFGLLSLFSIWNVYNWDILGWGTKLFLFPFLAVISFMAKLTPNKPPLFVRIQLGILVLHTALYFLVFNFQDPHAPNLLLLLLGFLLASIVLIFAKVHALETGKKQGKSASFQKQSKVLLLIAAGFYLSMGVLAHADLLLPGIIFELAALILYFYYLMRP
ncbi:MAG: hypothetical protein NWS92_07300 [Crocinitomicaceae bacterium]|jgi:hypothetical protein|nr:hypothetical protein [Crocinitomicaceae bacterium]MDP4724648.1 hypothetical protein [Crocinitomicaceae bacterium]MDP4739758.1 hypothetical protein [Crocinitomicaceae bacterium]MDP4798859.1 hypothetical protein [Crocinitomicaceae bacterium]MDP4806318.1 hypothetical protein [Crocinitomicaceae bacterium]